MAQRTKSEGKCVFCNQLFTKDKINQHLHKHLEEMSNSGKQGKSFLIKIESNPKWNKTPHFLSLWINGETPMDGIDLFLRQIWLECCGHLSAFTIGGENGKRGNMWDLMEAGDLLSKGKIKEYEKMMEDLNGEVPKSRKTKDVFSEGLILNYEYDFGSTTKLVLTVLEEYSIKANKPLVLLSRNEPLQLLCDLCHEEPAAQLCTIHDWDEPHLFCKKCSKVHEKNCNDFADYAAMPVVNSPRMGVCAYDGGSIDKERDVYIKK